MPPRIWSLASRLMICLLAMTMFTGARCGNRRSGTVVTQSVTGTNPGPIPISQPAALVELINQERARRGLLTLAPDGTLERVSLQYTTEVSAVGSVTYPFVINNADISTRLRDADYDFDAVGHIGAMNFVTAQSLHSALLASNSFVFTGTNFTRIGVSAIKGATHNYWTILVTD